MSTISPRNSSNPLRVADALAWVHTHVTQLGPEVIPVQEAAGRILAEDLAATLDLPPFNRVGADGFALRANEAVGASAYNPLPFRITPATADLPPNSAVRVTSGDVLPLGADAVVRIEHVELSAEEVVTIVDPVVAGNCVERIGCHLERGSTLVVAGRRLSPAGVGALASAGFARVPVTCRPRVHCVLVAARVVEAGQLLPPAEVYDANGPMLRALIHRDGGVLIEQRRIERDRIIGSHCVGLEHIIERLEEEGLAVKAMNVGSTGGLAAAKRGECDVAPIHLMDPGTGEYNKPFLTPGMELIRGYRRLQGIVFRRGDCRFEELSADDAIAAACAQSNCLMVGRNAGSGTRILLDRLLAGNRPAGYWSQPKSHNAVAAAVAQGRADWGLTIKTVARQYDLGFIPVQDEHYDFVAPTSRVHRSPVQRFRTLLQELSLRAELIADGFEFPASP